jgi:hypothetical protein
MAYTVTKLITNAYYLSGIVSRDFETVSGSQLTDGLDTLNDLLGDKTIDNGMIPYFDKYVFAAVADDPEYFIPNLIEADTFVFFINQVRYATARQQRHEFRCSSRAMNIQSLPWTWNLEKCFGGANLTLYFAPDQNYPLEIWGQFRLAEVALNQDLSLTLDRFYINYLKFELACRLCEVFSYNIPPDVKRQYDTYYQVIKNNSSVWDLRTQKISVFSGDGYINFGVVNLSGGWFPTY